MSESIWISAVHIPGKQNIIADCMSRSLNENTEWQFSPTIFKKIVRTFDFEPEIEPFASYLNDQVENYISWFPGPKANITDAFSIDWTNKRFYAFPPFSLIGAALAKIRDNQACGIMIMPIRQDFSLQVPSTIKLLILTSNKQTIHPLLPKMRLLAFLASGKQFEAEKLQGRLQKLSQDITQIGSMKQSLKDGNNMHYQGMKIPFIHL